jgi:uncharacterized membrane protein YeaQ/YmgE (transglycosylase-associated protein family)
LPLGGLISDIILGIIGALIAGWLLPMIHFPVIGPPMINAIIDAIIGAVILLIICERSGASHLSRARHTYWPFVDRLLRRA